MQSKQTMTIMKYQFFGLLYQAWGKTVVPTTICAGCGVYPFNPDAIDCGLSVAKAKPDKEGPSTVSNPADASNFEQPRGEAMISQKWPAEKVALFERRYEEGYDLPDEEYLRWLHETHHEVDREVSNVYLADYFSDLLVAEPMAIQPDFKEMADHGLQEENTVVDALADQVTQENPSATRGIVDEDRSTQEEALADHNNYAG